MIKDTPLKRNIRFIIILAFAFLVLYPLVWMVSSSFKEDYYIFKDLGLIPWNFTLENYINGWQSTGKVTFTTYYINSFIMVGLCVIGNLISCSLAAYSFARLDYKFKNLFFSIMFLTIMLPQHATLVPQYVYFHKLNWIDTFLPIVIPKFLAIDSFFIFLIVQFIRGIPRELDEAATADGCSKYSIFTKIILPLCVPALVTTTIFTFMWTWNDFFTQLLYLSNPFKYTVTMGLRMFIDPQARSSYGSMFAMSTLSIIPIMLLFVFFQRYLIEGISTSGLKG